MERDTFYLEVPDFSFPVRDISPNLPAREQDFCECQRGQESLRWWKDGNRIMPTLAVLMFEPCDQCNPITGVKLYSGWEDQDGIYMIGPVSPPLVPPGRFFRPEEDGER